MSNATPKSPQPSATQPFLIEKLTAPFDTDITLPGSKSIALRQLAIAALCSGSTQLTGVPECDDSAAMIDCLEALGANVTNVAGVVERQLNWKR